MCNLSISDLARIPFSDDFDLSEYVDSMFLMYGEKNQAVTLPCDYSVIGKVIDRFGSDKAITPVDDEHFEITETVSVATTFYSCLYYGGKIRITAPEEAESEFAQMFRKFCEE